MIGPGPASPHVLHSTNRKRSVCASTRPAGFSRPASTSADSQDIVAEVRKTGRHWARSRKKELVYCHVW
jgi:hypothetical protein